MAATKHNTTRLQQMMQGNHVFLPNLLHYFSTIDSTNRWLGDFANNKQRNQNNIHGLCCLAEHQTAGKGRRGRQWQSAASTSVLLSLGWDLQGQPSAGLSLVCGLAVVAALTECAIDAVQLKWPNDIYLNNKKLGGILIEIVSGKCVIGIGLNIKLPADSQIDQPWIDLSAAGHTIDRDEIVAALTKHHEIMLEQFSKTGFSSFQSQWNRVDVFRNQPVQVELPNSKCCGIARGVDEQGALVVESDGSMQSFYSGDVSLRAR